MGSTYTKLLVHTVFSTKHRKPQIQNEWRGRLHEYLGGTIKGLKAVPLGVGGTSDHVHLLFSTNTTHRLSDLMREIKKSSSSWVHNEIGSASFQWQEGYSAFSVSASAQEGVQSYIANQEEHHREKSFMDELVELLEKAGIEYDPKYLD